MMKFLSDQSFAKYPKPPRPDCAGAAFVWHLAQLKARQLLMGGCSERGGMVHFAPAFLGGIMA
jgi:hypothetical protein